MIIGNYKENVNRTLIYNKIINDYLKTIDSGLFAKENTFNGKLVDYLNKNRSILDDVVEEYIVKSEKPITIEKLRELESIAEEKRQEKLKDAQAEPTNSSLYDKQCMRTLYEDYLLLAQEIFLVKLIEDLNQNKESNFKSESNNLYIPNSKQLNLHMNYYNQLEFSFGLLINDDKDPSFGAFLIDISLDKWVRLEAKTVCTYKIDGIKILSSPYDQEQAKKEPNRKYGEMMFVEVPSFFPRQYYVDYDKLYYNYNYLYYNISLLFHKLMCEYACECGVPFETDVNYNVSRSEAEKLCDRQLLRLSTHGYY